MKLYLENGYLNVPALIESKEPFVFVTGGRGTGKSYGVMHYCISHNVPFIMMRRTLTEAEFLARDESTNPFRVINEDLSTDVHIEKSGKYTWSIVAGTGEDKRQCGLLLALSAVANMRGFSAEWCKLLFYDEFIPEVHVRPIKDEQFAFLNAVETIGRNRELKGLEPLKTICCSNANRLDNPLYLGLQLVTKVVSMQQKELEVMHLDKRGILLVNLMRSPISEAKAKTSLYTMCSDTGFSEMALDNKYIGETEVNPLIKRYPLSEIRPVVAIGEICIYKHKSNGKWYVSEHMSGTPLVLTMGDNDRARFRRLYPMLWNSYMLSNVYFENRVCEMLFCKAFS